MARARRPSGLSGERGFRAKNPPYGATFYVYLRHQPEGEPVVTIHDLTGKKISEVTGDSRAGVQAIQWDARVGQRRPGLRLYDGFTRAPHWLRSAHHLM